APASEYSRPCISLRLCVHFDWSLRLGRAPQPPPAAPSAVSSRVAATPVEVDPPWLRLEGSTRRRPRRGGRDGAWQPAGECERHHMAELGLRWDGASGGVTAELGGLAGGVRHGRRWLGCLHHCCVVVCSCSG
ncbi:unnamed protein product, partial [Urochloa humidicola]